MYIIYLNPMPRPFFICKSICFFCSCNCGTYIFHSTLFPVYFPQVLPIAHIYYFCRSLIYHCVNYPEMYFMLHSNWTFLLLLDSCLYKEVINICVEIAPSPFFLVLNYFPPVNSQEWDYWVKGDEHFYGFWYIWPNYFPKWLYQLS